MDYQLVVLKGRSGAKAVRLPDGVTTVGRQEGCTLTVRSSQVSRKHCQLFEKKGLLLVKDLGSANGTFVNGKRIEEQRVLEPGDLLMVGPIEFRIEAIGASAAPAASKAEVTTGSGERAKASDTSIPDDAEGPAIPLDDDDVLEFMMGEDEPTPAPAAKPKAVAPAAPAASAAPAPTSAPKPAPAPPPAAKPKPKPEDEPKDAPANDDGANEAIAEFLMGIELDDEDRR